MTPRRIRSGEIGGAKIPTIFSGFWKSVPLSVEIILDLLDDGQLVLGEQRRSSTRSSSRRSCTESSRPLPCGATLRAVQSQGTVTLASDLTSSEP